MTVDLWKPLRKRPWYVQLAAGAVLGIAWAEFGRAVGIL